MMAVMPTRTTGQYMYMASPPTLVKFNHMVRPRRKVKKQGNWRFGQQRARQDESITCLLRKVDANQGCAEYQIQIQTNN